MTLSDQLHASATHANGVDSNCPKCKSSLLKPSAENWEEVWYAREISAPGMDDWFADSITTYDSFEAANTAHKWESFDYRIVKKTLQSLVVIA